MARIFINYRRASAAGHAGRLYDWLTRCFGDDSVYIDVDMRIPIGTDFVDFITYTVQSSDAMLVLIDRYWLASTDETGRPRLENPTDFVRLEITTALRLGIPVVPVFIQDAAMPRAENLPDDLKLLARRQGFYLSDLRFRSDVAGLMQELDRVLSLQVKPAIPLHTVPSERVAEPEMITNNLGMTFARIPAGHFMMGTSAEQVEALIQRDPAVNRDWFKEEMPPHRVTISQPFYLGIHLVTQAQWEAVMGSNPSRFKGKADHPVDTVSWDEVQIFMQTLNGREGASRYRLPTEAEWEYACRAGSQAAYCFGDDAAQLGHYAWTSENAGDTTHPVGEKQGNAWGLYDMHGNVWEWCQDWYGRYLAEPMTNPVGPDAGADRVFRGGSWYYSALIARSACRSADHPGYRYGLLGFRCLSSGPSQ